MTGPAGSPGANGAPGSPGPTGPQGPAGTLFGEAASAFAGFTTTTTTGAAGGREALHAACAAAIPGSHFCHYAEYQLAASPTAVPAQGAWIDHSCVEQDEGGTVESGHVGCGGTNSSPDSGRFVTSSSVGNCASWTNAANSTGGVILDGTTTAVCNVARPLACCNTPYRETFRGFTSVTTNAGVGGRAAMHGRCALQFAGSHLCHLAEYERAHPAVSPPATGAWLDDSSYNSATDNSGAMPRSGRNTSPTSSCGSWTSGGAGSARVITATGDTTQTCDTTHALACCGG